MEDTMEVRAVKTETDIEATGIQSCSSPAGTFICGGCGCALDTACGLHVHMANTHSAGSYHYDNLIKTAFPKYDSFCATTQTTKEDKIYMKEYRRSKTGMPPKKMHGVNIKTEICDKYIIITPDEPIPQTTHVSMKRTFKRKRNSPLAYNLRHRSTDKQLKENHEYVAHERLNVRKDDINSQRPHTYRCVPNPTTRTEHGRTKTQAATTTLPVDGMSEECQEQNETPLVNDNGDAYDDDTDEGVFGSNHVIEEETADVSATSEDTFPIYSMTDVRDNSNSIDKYPLVRRRKTSRKCNNFKKRNIQEDIIDDAEDEDWNPVVAKRKKSRNLKKSRDEKILPGDSTVIVYADDVAAANDGEHKVHTKLRRNYYKKKDRKRFMCDICGAVMERHQKEAHMNDHLGLRPYICEVCAKSYATEKRLNIHIRCHDAEKGKGTYKCEVCGKTYASRQPYECHVNRHSGARPFKCELCDRMFPSTKNVKAHLNNMHTANKPLYCRICGKEYLKHVSLTTHMLTAHSAPKLSCRFCNRMFHIEKVRRHHELTHTGEKRYICCVCNHGFIQWTPYLEHMVKQHGFSKLHVKDITETQNRSVKRDNLRQSVAVVLPVGQGYSDVELVDQSSI